MRRELLAAALAAGLVCTAATDSKEPPAAGTPAGQPKAEEKKAGWFSRTNPFAPLVGTPEAKPAAPESAAPAETTPPTEAPKPAAPAAPAETAPKTAPETPRLNGILFSNRLAVAVVNDTIVKVNDQVAGYRVTSIGPDLLVAEKNGVRYVMTPRQPTAQVQAAPPASPPAPAGAAAEPPKDQTQSSGPAQTADKCITDVVQATSAAPAVPADGCSDEGEEEP